MVNSERGLLPVIFVKTCIYVLNNYIDYWKAYHLLPQLPHQVSVLSRLSHSERTVAILYHLACPTLLPTSGTRLVYLSQRKFRGSSAPSPPLPSSPQRQGNLPTMSSQCFPPQALRHHRHRARRLQVPPMARQFRPEPHGQCRSRRVQELRWEREVGTHSAAC